MVQKTYAHIQNYTKSTVQHDDLSLVAIKIDSNNEMETPISTKEIKVLSSKKNIKIIRDMVAEVTQSTTLEEEDVFNIKLAVNEAHANIIEHAYFGNEDGEIIFKFLTYSNRIEINIRDFGKGIGQKTIKGEEKHLEELEGSGLGAFLIKTIMDKVDYIKKPIGTELKLIKYFKKG